MIRLGLCCKFSHEPIRFRVATATALQKLDRQAALRKLADLCRANAEALHAALEYCTTHGIGCFRVNSQVLPVKTHPQAGYEVFELPGGHDIVARFEACGAFAREHGLRLSLHPDQFILLSSPREDVTARSVADLVYHAEVAEWFGADVINIHGGGAYGDKLQALERVRTNLGRLPPDVRRRLTFENDDRVYTPADLLPLCRAESIPFVYDVHHHRCLPDGQTVEEVTSQAMETWNREPLFHLSSPIAGWDGPTPRRHHDMIDPKDIPPCWRPLAVTVDVEAKAKEVAVKRLLEDLGPRPGIPDRPVVGQV